MPVVIDCTECSRPYLMNYADLGVLIYRCPHCGRPDLAQIRSRQHPSAAVPATRIHIDLRGAVEVPMRPA